MTNPCQIDKCNCHIKEEPIKGPYYCGKYWSKKYYPAKWKSDPLTRQLTRNKNGLLKEEEISVICNLMYKILEDLKVRLDEESNRVFRHDWKFQLDDIKHIVPVPLHECHTEYCTKACRYIDLDIPHTKAPVLANGLASMIRKKRNRKDCHSYEDVLVRVQRSDPYRKQHGKESRIASAKQDYNIAEYIVKNNDLIKDEDILLIDDITTSGGTVDACSRLLVDNGAKQVIILCAAETARAYG